MDANETVKLFSVMSFFNQNKWTLLIFFLLLSILIYGCVRVHIAKYTAYFDTNWDNVRCNAGILPIAGFIRRDGDKNSLQSTASNFQYCVNGFFKKSLSAQLNPMILIQNVINDGISEINFIIGKLTDLVNQSFMGISNIFGEGYNTLEAVGSLLYQGYVILTDIFNKVVMTLFSAMQYSLSGMTWGTMFVKLLYLAMMNIILIFYSTTVIPAIPLMWFFPPLIIYVVLGTLFLIIAEQFKSWVFIIVDAVASAEPFTLMNPKPKVSLCFDKNTPIKTKNKTKKIKNIRIGDILENGDIVTAIFKTLAPSIMFNLNGTIVSGEHYVYNGKWIMVKDHPDSISFDYCKKYLYCINTSSKRIYLNNTVFLDWDELSQSKIKRVFNYLKRKGVQPSTDQIHKCLDTGYRKQFLVKMENGNYKQICRIKPGDILNDSVKVMAIVRIKGDDLKSPRNKLYHLVTDKGYFKNIYFKDYNFIIDKLFYID